MLRGKLADEGIMKEDICLGTKATTQRSDTWKTKVKLASFFFLCCCCFCYEIVACSCFVKSNHGWNLEKNV